MTHLSLEQIHLQELALVPRGQIGLMVQEEHHLNWFHLDSGHQHNGLCFQLKQKNPGKKRNKPCVSHPHVYFEQSAS